MPCAESVDESETVEIDGAREGAHPASQPAAPVTGGSGVAATFEKPAELRHRTFPTVLNTMLDKNFGAPITAIGRPEPCRV